MDVSEGERSGDIGTGSLCKQGETSGAVKVDENGCSVASYTEIAITESMMIPDIQMTMKCNRPFIIIVSDEKGIPLFVGAVSRIE